MSLNIGKNLIIRSRQVIPQIQLNGLLAWIGVGFGFLTLAVVAWSLEQANWVNPQPSLITALGLAVAAGVMLAYIRIPGKIAVLIMLLIGLVVTVWQAAQLFTSIEEIPSLQLWWQTVSSSRPNESSVYFAMLLTFMIWVIGFISTWFILRKRSAWPTVFLGTVVLLANLNNLPQDMYYFFPLYFLSAILTLAAVSLAKRRDILIQWKEKSVRRGIAYFSVAVFSIAVIAVSIAYFIPAPNLSNLSLKTDKNAFGAISVEKLWFNIFADVTSKWMRIESQDKAKLLFKDPIESGSKIIFLVNAEGSDYWRTRRYDVYEPWGWSSTIKSEQELRPGELIIYNEIPKSEPELQPGEPITYDEIPPTSRTLTYTIESRQNTDVVISSGEVVSTNIPVEIQTFSLEDHEEIIPSPEEYRDIAAIVSRQIIRPYQLYQVVTNLTLATPEELTGAGEEYPEWVTGHYLQLPDSLPGRVRELSENITRDAKTPYDKAIAIENYLRKFPYNLAMEAPPEDSDGVDYFLFSTNEGDCRNFASAMAVMLRSEGIPARISIGYFRGELNKDTGNYALRGRNYHAWVEVYFPKYGWIEFEASPFSPQAVDEGIITDEGIIASQAAITGGGYNLSFSGSEELPPWMIEEDDSSGIAESTQIELAGRTSRWTYVPFLRIGILLAILLAISVFVIRKSTALWVDRLKQVETATDAYDRMCYLASRSNSGPFDHETPLEFGRRLTQSFPEHEDTINNIVQAYLAIKYSPREELEDSGQIGLEKAWVRLVPSLVKRILRQRKWAPVRLLWSSG